MIQDKKSSQPNPRRFLAGGGRMGTWIRSHDWSASLLGEPEQWPQHLKTAVSTCIHAPIPMLVFWGAELMVLYNDSFQQLIGKEHEPAARAHDVFSLKSMTVLRPLLQTAMEEGSAASTENLHSFFNGNVATREGNLTWHFSALYDAMGNAEGVICIGKQMPSPASKEGKELEEKMRQTQNRYLTLFNSIDSGFCIIEVLFDQNENPFNYSFLEINKAFEQQTGLQNAVGKTVNDFVQMEDFWYDVYGAVATTGKAVRFENAAENLNRFFEVYAFKIGEQHERKVGVLFTDISLRKQAEEGQARAMKAAKDSEARFRNLLQHAPVAATLFRGPELVIEIANELTLKYWGKSKNIIGRTLAEAAPELEDQQLIVLLKEMYHTGGTAYFAEKPITFFENGELKHGFYTYSVKALYDGSGQVEGILSIGIDVTEEVNTKKRTEESEAQLAFAIDAAELGVWDYNPLTNKFKANSRLKEWFGLQPEEEIDLSLAVEVMEKGDRNRVTAAIQKAQSWGGGEYDIEYCIINPKTSQRRMVRAKGKATFGEDRIAYRFNGILQDVTVQSDSRQRIEESEANLRNVVVAAPIGMCVMDAATLVNEIANERFVEISGKPLEAILGKTYWHTFAEAKIHYEAALQGVIDTGVPFFANEVELMLIRHGREENIHVTFVYMPMKNADGIVTKVVVWVLDNSLQVQARRLVEESESRFRALVNATSDVVFRMDADWNDRSNLEVNGFLSGTDETHRNWMEKYIHPEDRARVKTAIAKAIKEKSYFELEHRVIRIDGTMGWNFFRATPIIGGHGEIIEWFGATSDITERKLIDQSLIQSESRFRALVEEAPVATCLFVGKDLKIEIANERIIAIMGKGPSVVGKPLAEAVPELNGQPFLHELEKAFETGENYENRNARADLLVNGEMKVFYVDYIFKPLKDSNGRVYAILDMTIDVTSHVLARMELQKSEERFRMLSNEMPQFVWTGDPAGNLNYFNKAVYQYTGLSEQEMANSGWLQIVHPEDKAENIRLWLQCVATGEDFIYEHRFLRADGEYHWQLSRAVAQRDAQGIIQQWIGTSTDIQDQKNVEESLERLVLERTKELQRSNEDLQQFAHVTSHDLKEPVRKIKTFLSRLDKEYGADLPPRGKEFVQKMDSAASRIYNMIDGVLLYSSVDALEGNKESVSLTHIIEEVLEDMELIIEQKGARIHYSALPDLLGIRVLLHQLFYNLINNALKFSKAGVNPVITIHAEVMDKAEITGLLPSQEYVRLVIEDNGIGFEPGYADEIFKTFKRLNAKDKFEGTGLGLALCKKIVERHGGTISATGELGEGASFTVVLPSALS